MLVRAIETVKQRKLVTLALLVALAFPIFIRDTYILHVIILTYIYIILAQSWNLVCGYGGVFNLAPAGFFGIGAYASALLAMRVGVSPWFSIFFGGAFAGLLGLGLGLPCLRLRARPYVAIVTIAFGEILRITVSNLVELTRGQLGLWGIPPFSSITILNFSTISFGTGERIPDYYLILILCSLSLFILYKLINSAIGLNLLAIREDQDAAEALGINTTHYKLLTFTVSSFFMGMTGGFYAHYIQILAPGALGWLISTNMIMMTILGGLGTFVGPIIGAAIIMFLTEALRAIGDLRLVIYGALVILIIIFSPKGVVQMISSAIRWLGTRISKRTIE